MPTGLLNVVCDECHGGRLVCLPTNEIQLEHQVGCPYKYREDTFLINLQEQLDPKRVKTYPNVKLNPIIYDLFSAGYFRKGRNKINGPLSKNRANKVNENLQLIREAMIKDGTWPHLRKTHVELVQ